jgi:hypothetical protein
MHSLQMRTPITACTRGDAIAILKRRIEYRYWPRWSAFWIACVTALFGAFFSAILWRLGMEAMAWRYPLSVLLSYLVLLALLDSWSRRRWDDWFQGDGSSEHSLSSSNSGSNVSCRSDTSYAGEGGNFGGAGASDSFDSSSAFDAGGQNSSTVDLGSVTGDALSTGFEAAASADEGVVVTIPLFLIFALLLLFGGFAFGLISLIWSAPTLLAHLMLDAGTASLLAVYVRPAHRESWWSTVFWKTFPKFLALAVLMMIAGYSLEWFDPTAITLFDVLANR